MKNSQYIIPDLKRLGAFKKTGKRKVCVSMYRTRYGEVFYSQPCDPSIPPKPSVQYRIHVRLK